MEGTHYRRILYSHEPLSFLASPLLHIWRWHVLAFSNKEKNYL
jgi:hypothetical protein